MEYRGVDGKDEEFQLKMSKLGTTTNPFGANQLEELGKKLNIGVNNVELGTLKMKDFETLPSEHLEESRRLAELTGSNLSFHAPIDLDIAGFTEKAWSEEKRMLTEMQLSSVLDRASAFRKEDGPDVPVVIHASGAVCRQFEKGLMEDAGMPDYDEEGYEIQKLKDPGDKGMRVMGVVNQDTGEIQHLQHSEKYRLGMKDKEVWDVHKGLRNLNSNKWHDDQLELFSLQHDVAEREDKMVETQEKILELQQKNDALQKTGLIHDEGYAQMYEKNNEQAEICNRDIENLRNQVDRMDVKLHSRIDDLGGKFRAFGNSDTKKKFDEFNKGFIKIRKQKREIEKEYIDLSKKQQLTKEEEKKLELLGKDYRKVRSMERKVLTGGVAQMEAPKVWKSMTDFGMDKSAETVANSVFNVFDKRGDKMPFIAVENAWLETGFSRGEELRELIDKSRDKFAEKLVKEKGLSEGVAKAKAEKLIGATWDVGHINALRKAGYTEDELEKFVLKETAAIAKGGKHVKHVHITDNFGFEDTHLAPGMGNVPIKKILENMEKEGVLKNARVIEESGAFINAFKRESAPFTMSHLGSPMYSEGGPLYEKDQLTQYGSGFIEFPQKHFDMYGSSFSSLPTSVGGQAGGGASRFSGTPNQ